MFVEEKPSNGMYLTEEKKVCSEYERELKNSPKLLFVDARKALIAYTILQFVFKYIPTLIYNILFRWRMLPVWQARSDLQWPSLGQSGLDSVSSADLACSS